jgi:hypothetical protein
MNRRDLGTGHSPGETLIKSWVERETRRGFKFGKPGPKPLLYGAGYRK